MSAEAPYYSKDFATLVQDLLGHLQSPGGGRTALTDITEGSVARTLLEAFARELAVCYEQLHLVYRYGYLDTAEGVALDNVVALLGISRQRAGHLEGNVTFSRQQPAPEDIPIPAGTLVAGRDIPLFETVNTGLLRKDDRETLVAVRSVEPGGETVLAGKITVMPRPILGIEMVTNPTALILRQREEGDEELRERARHVLQRANLGTPAALEQAVKSLGIAQVTLREEKEKPGRVQVILGDLDISEDLLNQAKKAVEKVRPAGICIEMMRFTPLWVQVTATLLLDADYSYPQRQSIQERLEQELTRYFAGLKVGELLGWDDIKSILTSFKEIVKVVDIPVAGGYRYLEPFMGTPGHLESAQSTHLVADDIRVEPTEKALLDTQVLPLRLSLEAPILTVWVDVAVVVATDQAHKNIEADLTQMLTPVLDTFKPGQTVRFEQLADALRALQTQIKKLTFTSLHARDGLAVLLTQAGDTDSLAEREKLKLGRIVVTGGRNG